MLSTPASPSPTLPIASLPRLCVAVIHTNQTDGELLATLAALADPCRLSGAELLLIGAAFARLPAVRRLAPACRVLVVDSGLSPEALRAAAVRAATGDIIFLIDGSSSAQERRVIRRLDARRLTAVTGGKEHAASPAPLACQVQLPTGDQGEVSFDELALDGRPFLSVIVPVHRGAAVIEGTLRALRASDFASSFWELIVVDDASTDNTVDIASRYADVLVRIPLRAHGPAYARNRGFDVSLGECAVFVDADVQLHPESLRRFATAFVENPSASAIVGSYDAHSPASGVVSQYRNLLHHFAHRDSRGDTETFWAPCGAIRRSAFLDCGMFNEWHFFRPTIEDLELGQRLRALGHRIVVRPDIQGTHVKDWTLLSAITCDLRDRNVPWMRLILGQPRGHSAGISLRAIERINVAGTWLALVCLLIGSIAGDPRWVFSMAMALMPVVFANRRVYAFFLRTRGVGFTLSAIPLHLLYYVLLGVAIVTAWVLRILVGDPRPEPIVEAFAEVGVERWPPVPSKRYSFSSMQASAARV